MQAVILMAGKGTRWAKYYQGPKQLTPLAGKPVLDHLLDALPSEVTELVFIVGGPHEPTLREYFKSREHNGRPITFIVQKEQLGLAHAFRVAKDIVKGRWLGAVADDIIDPAGLKKLFDHDLSILAFRVPNPSSFGVLVTDENHNLVRAVEKPKEYISDLVWTGQMIMDERFFNIEIEPSARGEYETPDVWMKLMAEGATIKVVEADMWLPINDKDQLMAAEKVLGSATSD
ncbi:MAG: NTP transferase domain-containing protein [Candidatus Andersenbacteria bacterium]|nr:NTP transferase domain-containing protein [Candidatus Andersenbacteria bacterium]MBI3251004.1 NTP transferase domain-containing protein [Candidatus Andersenbacteria bacterium]